MGPTSPVSPKNRVRNHPISIRCPPNPAALLPQLGSLLSSGRLLTPIANKLDRSERSKTVFTTACENQNKDYCNDVTQAIRQSTWHYAIFKFAKNSSIGDVLRLAGPIMAG
jgi:hypothetical protein